MSARTQSPEDTLALGRRLGASLQAGDVLGLVGPLGAGKTLLVRGIVAGLQTHAGLSQRAAVCSPSFTMVNTYELGPELQVHHMDLYRVTGVDDLESVGYWDAIADPHAVSLIEWLDQVDEARVARSAQLVLEVEDPRHPDTSPRRFVLVPGGDPTLSARLAAALQADP